jgi:hypothetical protein
MSILVFFLNLGPFLLAMVDKTLIHNIGAMFHDIVHLLVILGTG